MKLPLGWSRLQLGNLLTRHPEYGANAPSVNYDPLHTPRLIRITDIDSSGRLLAHPRVGIDPAAANDCHVRQGDLLLARTGATVGKSMLVGPDCDYPAVFAGYLIRIIVDERKAVTRYVYQYLNSPQYALWVKSVLRAGAQPNINAQEYAGLVFPCPPLPEQRKIADILGTWDEALEKLDALIAAKERSKQALMQQLLHAASEKAGHGHTRYRLGSVVDRVTRKNTEACDNVLTISGQDGLINQREYFNRSVAGADLSKYFLLRRGEFAYNRSSSNGFPYGAIKRLDRYDTGVVSTLYLCFRIRDEGQVSSDYLSHYLDGGYINPGLRSVAKEGARAHGLLNVTADEFLDLDIFLPPLDMQRKIAAILSSADTELRILRQQCTNLDHQKRGLMQQLLTGKMRVVA